jgi:hypothetical protein
VKFYETVEVDEEWETRTTEGCGSRQRAGTRAELFKALLHTEDGDKEGPTSTALRAMQNITRLLATGAAPKDDMYAPFFAAGRRIVPAVAKKNG